MHAPKAAQVAAPGFAGRFQNDIVAGLLGSLDLIGELHAPQVFGGDHSITQWMTVPSLEKLTGGIIMQAGKHRDSHIKQVALASAGEPCITRPCLAPVPCMRSRSPLEREWMGCRCSCHGCMVVSGANNSRFLEHPPTRRRGFPLHAEAPARRSIHARGDGCLPAARGGHLRGVPGALGGPGAHQPRARGAQLVARHLHCMSAFAANIVWHLKRLAC